MMVSYSIFGVTEFAARLPSALFGIGTCLLTWSMGRRLFGANAGVWAAVILATTMMFDVASRAATPDAPLIFFSTLAIWFYVLGTTAPPGSALSGFVREFPTGWTIPCLMYAAMGMAVLAKGPIGLVLPTAVIGMSLLIRRLPASAAPSNAPWESALVQSVRPFAPIHFLKTCWSMRPITAVLMVLAVALPWYVWVHLRTNGAWTSGFFLEHNLERATRAMDGHHGNVLYYPVALLIGFFPWSVFWLPALMAAVRVVRQKSPLSNSALFSLCWVGVYVALFSIARTKLPSYITPCYPGMALLTGMFIDHWVTGQIQLPAVWRRLSLGTLIFAGVGIAVVLPILCSFLLPGEEWLGIAGVVPLLGGLFALIAAEKGRTLLASRWVAGTAVAMSLLIFSVIADRVDGHRRLEDLVSAIAPEGQLETTEIASLSGGEGSWVFYCGQPIRRLASTEQAMDYLRSPSPDGKTRVLIATGKRLQQDDAISPLSAYVVHRVPYFMRRDDIVILKPQAPVLRSAEAPNPYEVR